MTDKDTGGTAFPATNHYGHKLTGMTLRDYFAAKAMHGWLSTYPTDHGPEEVYEYGVAEFAYRIADTMLKVRGEE